MSITILLLHSLWPSYVVEYELL